MATITDLYVDESLTQNLTSAEISDGVLKPLALEYSGYASFNGSSAYIDLDGTVDDSWATSFSISCFYKMDTINATNMCLIGSRNGNSGMMLYIDNTGRIVFYARGASNWAFTVDDTAIDNIKPYRWNHIAAVFRGNGNQAEVWMNGKLQAEATAVQDFVPNGATMRIARQGADSTPSYWPGSIKEMKIYNNAITFTEIQALYRGLSIPSDTTDLEAHYKFNGDATDETGNHNGTNQGATFPTTDLDYIPSVTSRMTSSNVTASVVSTSIDSFAYTVKQNPGDVKMVHQFCNDYDADRENVLDLNGTSQYINVADGGDLNFTSGNFSLVAWIKPDVISGTQIIFYKGAWKVRGYYFYVSSTGAMNFNINQSGANTYILTTDGDITVGEWQHVVATRNGTVGSVYINGTEAVYTTRNSINDAVTSPDDFAIGVYKSTLVQYFNGQIADAHVYDKSLTAAEALWLYTNGASGTDPTTTNLVGHWEINEGTGTSIVDSSVNANNGTAVGTPTWTTDTHLAQWLPSWVNSNGDSVKQRGSYYFDGVNDYIVCGVDAVRPVKDLTFSAWVWWEGDGTNPSPGGVSGTYEMLISGTVLGWRLRITGSAWTNDFLTSNIATFPSNQWVHIAGTYNGTSQNLYVNGVLNATRTPANANLDYGFARQFGMGALDSSSSAGFQATSYWPGYIKDVRVYSEALAASDIFNLYTGSTEPSATNLDEQYKLDGNVLSEGTTDGTNNGATPVPDWFMSPVIGDVVESHKVQHFTRANSEYISTNNSLDDGIGSGSFTVAGWFKFDGAVANTSNNIINNRVASTNGFMVVYVPAHTTAGSALSFSVFGTSVDFYADDIEVPFDQWNHFSCVFVPSGTAKIYINSVLSTVKYGDNTATTTYQNSTTVLDIGRQNALNYFDGYISNLAMFDDELTTGEIDALYALGPFGTISTTHDHVMEIWPLRGTFEGTVAGNNGTNNGSETVIYSPVQQFDGTNDEVSLDGTIDDNWTSEFSISFWFYFDNDNNTTMVPVSNRSGSSGFEIQMNPAHASGRQLSIDIWDSGTTDICPLIINNDNAYETHGWHMAACVFRGSGNTGEIYVDGVSWDTAVASGAYGPRTTTLTIGARSGASPFEGRLANAAFFNVGLTAGEVLDLYHSGNVPLDHRGLEHYYPLAGDFKDYVGSVDGTNSGSTEVQDAYRPQALEPISISSNVSSLAYTDTFYYRQFQDKTRIE